MDNSWLSRTSLLIKEEKVELLNTKHLLIVGMGGVGSYAAEFLCRAGFGTITIVDGDTIDNTNRNRQLPALSDNIGDWKADVMAERLKAINPELKLNVIKEFITPEVAPELMHYNPDYVVDAIDTIQPKITLIEAAIKAKKSIASSMGAGGKLDPTQIRVADISKSFNCPFALKVRKALKKKGIYKGFKVAFSPEKVIEDSLILTDGLQFKKSAYGTISYLPAAFGGVLASIVIRDLISDFES